MQYTHRTRNGVILNISEMTDLHLQNTIAAKERWWLSQIGPYLDEAKRRGLRHLPWYRRLWFWIQRKTFLEEKFLQRCSVKTNRAGYGDMPFREPFDIEEVEDLYNFDILDQEYYH